MIDIRLVREQPDEVATALCRRGVAPETVTRLLEFDSSARSASSRRDDLRAQVKELSRQVADARRGGDAAAADQLTAQSRDLGELERAADSEATSAGDEVRAILLELPNLPSPEAPEGLSPEDNVVVRNWPAEPRRYEDYQRVAHWEVGEALGILDMERGAKLSGSMFPCFKGLGARLVRALSSYALDAHADAFEEVRPPTLVRTETMISTGHLPKFADDAYHLERDDLWAIPTSEVPLTSMYRNEILEESELPLRYTASTSCFRREAGAAGRDTRGLLRVHEFDKVELFSYTTAEQARAAHTDMLGRATRLLEGLNLEYRVVDLCAGDLGISSARTFDLEVYAPGCDMWLEVSSVSWCSDYQARRANVRYRPSGGGAPVLAHTLNGSALAWPRIWAALVECGRRADGTVRLPATLEPYLGTRTIGKAGS
ncbi:MAG: serine--tRNA ligase [Acidimicrobiales bacterium]